MSRISRPLLAVLAGSTLGAAEVAVYPGNEWASVAPAEVGMDAELVARAAERFGEVCGRDGSREIVIVRDGRIVWQGEDIDRLHPVWSCTKSFLSTCFGLLWDDGKCSPDTRAAEVLPALEEAYGELTLGQLASFTGGYAHDKDNGTIGDPGEPLHPPGAAMHYGKQSDLLALVLTRLAGEPLHELFMRRIGRPIGITDEQIEWGLQDLGDEEIPVNGGSGVPPAGVSITARAMARFCWLYCQDGVWAGERLISQRYIDAATAVQVPASIPPHDPKAWYVELPGHYGLNWWVNGEDPDDLMWPSLPVGSFAVQGNRNNIGVIVPEWNLVIVRQGTDPAVDARLYDQAFELLRQALVKGGGLSAE